MFFAVLPGLPVNQCPAVAGFGGSVKLLDLQGFPMFRFFHRASRRFPPDMDPFSVPGSPPNVDDPLSSPLTGGVFADQEMSPVPESRLRVFEGISYVLFSLGLLFAFIFGLIPALLGAVVAYSLVIWLSGKIFSGANLPRARRLALMGVSLLVVLALSGVGLAMFSFLSGASLSGLVTQITHVLEEMRPHLPDWMTSDWPSSMRGMPAWLGQQLSSHAAQIQGFGSSVATGLGRVLLGLVIGGMAAAMAPVDPRALPPFPMFLRDRVSHFVTSFGDVVSAQVKISAVNAVFTGLFLMLCLPLFGFSMPFAKTLTVLTFVVGLLPVIGNLVSNTAITLIALSVSPALAAICLGYLVVIHKFEYFLNARFVGGSISAKSWEVLAAMVAGQAIFGLSGVIMAPIVYAWVKREMRSSGLI